MTSLIHTVGKNTCITGTIKGIISVNVLIIPRLVFVLDTNEISSRYCTHVLVNSRFAILEARSCRASCGNLLVRRVIPLLPFASCVLTTRHYVITYRKTSLCVCVILRKR